MSFLSLLREFVSLNFLLFSYINEKLFFVKKKNILNMSLVILLL